MLRCCPWGDYAGRLRRASLGSFLLRARCNLVRCCPLGDYAGRLRRASLGASCFGLGATWSCETAPGWSCGRASRQLKKTELAQPEGPKEGGETSPAWADMAAQKAKAIAANVILVMDLTCETRL
jgi:hypothetical protein